MEIEALTLSDNEFSQIRDIVRRSAGISLADSKKALVVSRLARRLNELKIHSFLTYINRLKGDADEVLFMINRITTNLTRFYRENAQFNVLRESILPEILKAKREKGEDTLRIWSAGCSTGEEVYSILFEVLAYFKGTAPVSPALKIMGSDIDTNVLRKAASGIYTVEELNGLDEQTKNRYFHPVPGGGFQVRDRFKKYTVFTKLNLVHDEFKFKNRIDVIFCRNVVIYFDQDSKQRIYEKFNGVMNDPGFLFSGHSENLFRYADLFKFVKKGVYKKVL
jgi:chemotaxis protein methyltransferase CheR